MADKSDATVQVATKCERCSAITSPETTKATPAVKVETVVVEKGDDRVVRDLCGGCIEQTEATYKTHKASAKERASASAAEPQTEDTRTDRGDSATQNRSKDR